MQMQLMKQQEELRRQLEDMKNLLLGQQQQQQLSSVQTGENKHLTDSVDVVAPLCAPGGQQQPTPRDSTQPAGPQPQATGGAFAPRTPPQIARKPKASGHHPSAPKPRPESCVVGSVSGSRTLPSNRYSMPSGDRFSLVDSTPVNGQQNVAYNDRQAEVVASMPARETSMARDASSSAAQRPPARQESSASDSTVSQNSAENNESRIDEAASVKDKAKFFNKHFK
jgi:hypothetical protein